MQRPNPRRGERHACQSGGGVTYLRNILPLLAEDSRLEIHIFLHVSQMDIFYPLNERIHVHLFDFPQGLARLMFWEQLILPILVRVMSADVVFSPANFGSLLVRDQAILLRNALAVARTEPRLSKRIYWIMLGTITFLSLMRCRRAIAVSTYAARSLSLGCYRWFEHKVRVIYHGIDTRFYPDNQSQPGTFLLAVSDIYVQKNLHTLFRALPIICEKYPDIRLIIAGQLIDEWYFNSAVDLANQLGVRKNIEFIGRIQADDLRQLYQSCRAFVFPSTAETFGMPLVEAMACGAPIVSSSSTAMPEIVGDAALLFDPSDPEDIARSILQVIDDDVLRADLSARSLKRATQFSWKQAAKQTADVLVEVSTRGARV